MVDKMPDFLELLTKEERFATLWDNILLLHDKSRGQLPASKLGVTFTECLDPDPDEWSIWRVLPWFFSTIAVAAFVMMCFALYDGKYATLWLSPFLIAFFLTWYFYKRRYHPSDRQLERCLRTQQQFDWYGSLEKSRRDFELGKKTALSDPEDSTTIIPAKRFEGINGLRLIIKSGAMGAEAREEQLFTELEMRETPYHASSKQRFEENGEQPQVSPKALMEQSLPMKPGTRKRNAIAHPFELVQALYFPVFLEDFLKDWNKPLSEKKQFRAVNLVLFDIIKEDPNLSIKELMEKVRAAALDNYQVHLQYSDEILAKIVGKSAEGKYGAFKKYALKRLAEMRAP